MFWAEQYLTLRIVSDSMLYIAVSLGSKYKKLENSFSFFRNAIVKINF